MTHICTLRNPPFGQLDTPTALQKCRRKIQEYTLISPKNPFRFQCFKSDMAIRREQNRQLSISNWIIHPYSKFRQWYDIYLIYLYVSVLVTKPLDVSFLISSQTGKGLSTKTYILFTDVLCWIDIILNFRTGCVLADSLRSIELRPSYIAQRYLFSPYFICDTLSSIPISLFPREMIHPLYYTTEWMGIVKIFCLLKAIRVISIIVYIDKLARYSETLSRGVVFLVCNIFLLLIVIHWIACIQFGVSVAVRTHFWPETANHTWVSRAGMANQTIHKQYVHSFFKSSAYILGVRLTNIYKEMLVEEYIMAVGTYLFGKILVILTWTSIAAAILNSRSVSIKFAELFNQLDEYMKQKQFPLNLQQKITSYYNFKYEGKYVREDLITSLLPNKLNMEVKLHECRSLISSIALFQELLPYEVNQLVNCLQLQIYLPNDSIVQPANRTEAMYFILSGTVAVYTRSGKELCHLQDGAYFGEVALILKAKFTMFLAVAIETCQIYKLSRKNFNKYLLTNANIMEQLMEVAEKKLKVVMEVEEDYWKALFEKAFMHKEDKTKQA